MTDVEQALDDLIGEIRSDLRARIEFNYEVLSIPPEDEDARLLRVWCTALGALSFDISGSAVFLIQRGDLRAAAILSRCLFEYWTRLGYYSKNIDEARADSKQVLARYQKMMRAEPTDLVRSYPDEVQAAYEGARDADMGKIERENFRVMVEDYHGKELGSRYYDRFYALQSVLVHGHEGIIPDVFRNLSLRIEPKNQVEWSTRRWKSGDTLAVVAQILIGLLFLIERISDRGNAAIVLRRKFAVLSAQLEKADNPV